MHFCFRHMGLWREIRYMLVLSMHFFMGPACVSGMMRMEKVACTHFCNLQCVEHEGLRDGMWSRLALVHKRCQSARMDPTYCPKPSTRGLCAFGAQMSSVCVARMGFC